MTRTGLKRNSRIDSFREAVFGRRECVRRVRGARPRHRRQTAPLPNGVVPTPSAHWNVPDRGGSRDFVNVFRLTNAASIELYQNDEYLGEHDANAWVNRPMDWYVPDESGTRRAVAKNGTEVVAEHELVTAAEPEAVDRTTGPRFGGDGRDVAFACATVPDADGTRVRDASNKIQFGIDAPGTIIQKSTPFTGERKRVVTPTRLRTASSRRLLSVAVHISRSSSFRTRMGPREAYP